MTNGGVTPVIVMNDPHKHLGTDKGISTIIGTKGSLSYLEGQLMVGMTPDKDDLVRAAANTRLIGRDGYFDIYHTLVKAVEAAIVRIESCGAKIIHKENRAYGSTVIAVEDPSGAASRKMKKLGHSLMQLFDVNPSDPGACQTGWQLSMTVHHLREIEDGKTALSIFLDDFERVQQDIKARKALALTQKYFRESSLLSYLVSGNLNPYLFRLLACKGFKRQVPCTLVRRYITATLDYGAIRAQPKETVLFYLLTEGEEFLRRIKFALITVFFAVMIMRLRRMKK